MRSHYRPILIKLLAGIMIMTGPILVNAETRSSASFIISSDDISVGGDRSTSASYAVQDDLGGNAAGENVNSLSYRACAGYPCTLSIEPPTITFSVAPNAVNFGTLTSAVVATGDVTITTSTNSATGYATTVATDGAFRSVAGDQVHGVSDGAVTAGHDEYGIGLTGADRAFADDRSISTALRVVASNAGPVTSAATTVTFKAAISPTVPAGAYSQIATFVSTAEF